METLSTYLVGNQPLVIIPVFKWILYGFLGLAGLVALISLIVVIAALKLSKQIDDDTAASRNEVTKEKERRDFDKSAEDDPKEHYLY